ncbi:cytochrome C oxidase subunit IV family protein [Mycobacterium avium]
MNWILRNPAIRTWTLLVAATFCSFGIFESAAANGRDVPIAGGLVIAIAFIKVRLIGLRFMELRSCPLWMRGAFELWVIAIGSVLIIMQ